MPAPLPFVQTLDHGIHVIDTGFHRPRFDASYLVVEDGRAAFVDTGTNHSVPRLLADFFGLPLSLGSVVALQQTGSAALEGVYAAIHTAVQQQDRCNIDETGWKEAGNRRWLWTMVTTIAMPAAPSA